MNLDNLNNHELEELRADAQAVRNSEGFKFVMESLRQRYLNELLNAEVGGLTAASAHASMKVLRDFESEFDIFTNEVTMRGNNRHARSR